MTTPNGGAYRTRRASTMPAAKAAVVTIAKTALLGQAEVYYGSPPDAMSFPHMIFRNIESDDDWAELGNNGQDEIYTLEWFAAARTPGGTQQEATEAVFAIYALFSAAMRKNPSLGGLVQSALLKIRRAVEDPSDNARLTFLHGGIVVKARI